MEVTSREAFAKLRFDGEDLNHIFISLTLQTVIQMRKFCSVQLLLRPNSTLTNLDKFFAAIQVQP